MSNHSNNNGGNATAETTTNNKHLYAAYFFGGISGSLGFFLGTMGLTDIGLAFDLFGLILIIMYVEAFARHFRRDFERARCILMNTELTFVFMCFLTFMGIMLPIMAASMFGVDWIYGPLISALAYYVMAPAVGVNLLLCVLMFLVFRVVDSKRQQPYHCA